MVSEFKVYIHLCEEGERGGCFTDTHTLPDRPEPTTLKALLDETTRTFALLFDAEPDSHVVELSKAPAESEGVLDPAAVEKP